MIKLGSIEVHPGITVNPEIMGGVPCIVGQRMPVRAIFNAAQSGNSREAIKAMWDDSFTDTDIANALIWRALPKKVRKAKINAALERIANQATAHD